MAETVAKLPHNPNLFIKLTANEQPQKYLKNDKWHMEAFFINLPQTAPLIFPPFTD